MRLISQTVGLWDDPRLVYAIAIVGIVLLAITVWLFRRAKRDGRAAGTICLILAIGLHAALIWLVPYQASQNGGSATQSADSESPGVDTMMFSTFDPELAIDDASGQDDAPAIAPLPVAELEDLLTETFETPTLDGDVTTDEIASEVLAEPIDSVELPSTPQSLSPPSTEQTDSEIQTIAQDLDSSLDELLQSQLQVEQNASAPDSSAEMTAIADTDVSLTPQQTTTPPIDAAATQVTSEIPTSTPKVAKTESTAAVVPGSEKADFANRAGAAKQIALTQTGGDAETEAAVQAALRFLAQSQRRDGAWDPRDSGAGVERRPLGESRFGAGTKSTSGLTGLSLLAMMGSGNTHLSGDYADNVYRGLAHLIQNQNPDGSLSGNATIYAASYCHSMAALSVCEAAVMTGDPSAIESSRRAIDHTIRMQHPVTGGWRYTRGDPGDLSQLGWQAMVLDAGKRAGISIRRENVAGVARFLRSVRVGSGGLACYRPGEATSRTMTAEALATRLLIGEDVPQQEIAEAQRYLLQAIPGSGQDNYYYWYYATLALHQLQDDAWVRWNTALKNRLLATQRPDGSWPASTVWGGYGGTVYTTAMATLCLETYYRHAIRDSNAKIATRP